MTLHTTVSETVTSGIPTSIQDSLQVTTVSETMTSDTPTSTQDSLQAFEVGLDNSMDDPLSIEDFHCHLPPRRTNAHQL